MSVKRQIPDWVTHTPDLDLSRGDATAYVIYSYDDLGEIPDQQINLTKDEFIQLKRKLAELRGFVAPRRRRTTARASRTSAA